MCIVFWVFSHLLVSRSFLIFTSKYQLYTLKSCATFFYKYSTVRGERLGGGGGGGGVPWVAWRRPHPHMCFQSGIKFNLSTRFPILDPSPATVPVGDWRDELHRSFGNRTSQRKLRCVHLPTPVIAKGVLPFYLS